MERKLALKFTGGFVSLFFAAQLMAQGLALQWGGPGFDPELRQDGRNATTRFSARRSTYRKNVVEIRVDDAATVREVGSIRIVTGRFERPLESTRCWKAMRHPTAPWACEFSCGDLRSHSGNGRIEVLDRNGRVLLKGPVDLTKLGALAAEDTAARH